MLDDGDGGEAAHHGHADQLQADVQPLHGSFAQELAALVQVQALGVLLLEPGPGPESAVGRRQPGSVIKKDAQSTSEERRFAIQPDFRLLTGETKQVTEAAFRPLTSQSCRWPGWSPGRSRSRRSGNRQGTT